MHNPALPQGQDRRTPRRRRSPGAADATESAAKKYSRSTPRNPSKLSIRTKSKEIQGKGGISNAARTKNVVFQKSASHIRKFRAPRVALIVRLVAMNT